MSEKDQNQDQTVERQTPDAGGENQREEQLDKQQPSQQRDETEPTWLPDRLRRAKESARRDLLAELGIEDPDEAKTVITRAKELEEQSKSENEKLLGQLEKERKAREKAEQQLLAAAEAQRKMAIDSALRSAAVAANAEAPEDVIMLARNQHADDVEALLKDDGKVDDAKAKALVDKIREVRPRWFVGKGPGSPSNQGGQPPGPDTATNEVVRSEAAMRARHQF